MPNLLGMPLKRYLIKGHLRRTFKLTFHDYMEMYRAQGGRCAICRRLKRPMLLVVDHDYKCCPQRRSCGKCVRGLLCRKCNLGLGALGENNLSAAIEYTGVNK